MSIRKILIAVDDQPLSVRAAELGAELARALGGEMALIHVNAQGYPGDTGIPPQQLICSSTGGEQAIRVHYFYSSRSARRVVPFAADQTRQRTIDSIKALSQPWSVYAALDRKPIPIAPFDRNLELAVIDRDGPHT